MEKDVITIGKEIKLLHKGEKMDSYAVYCKGCGELVGYFIADKKMFGEHAFVAMVSCVNCVEGIAKAFCK